MNNIIFHFLVKLFVTTKHLIAITLFFGIAVIILFAVFFLVRKKSLLIDYLPKDTPFWFWQRGGGYDARAVELLGLLGLDPKIRAVLEGRKEDIIIYLKDGKWYRLEAKGLDGEPKRKSGDAFRALTSDPAATIIGSARSDYIQERLGSVFTPSFTDVSYYFILKPAPKTLSFQIIPVGTVLENKVEAQILLPEFPSSVILAFQTPDRELKERGAAYIQGRIREAAAFQNPVVIEKTLPDGTVSKERIVDPTLFTWVSREPYFFELVVDNKVAFVMYEDEKRVVVASLKQDLTGGNVKDESISSFFYLNPAAVPEIEFVDILGKSDAFSWLQRADVKRIIVGETKTYVEGELTF